MANREWHIHRQGIVKTDPEGPYSEKQLIELVHLGKIKTNTLLYHDTGTKKQWVEATRVPKIAEVINQRCIEAEKAKQANKAHKRQQRQEQKARKKSRQEESLLHWKTLVILPLAILKGILEAPMLIVTSAVIAAVVLPTGWVCYQFVDAILEATGFGKNYDVKQLTFFILVVVGALAIGVPLTIGVFASLQKSGIRATKGFDTDGDGENDTYITF